ncbi:hypothetical protein [Nitrosomonas sp. Nm51]|uniref:hypothetical protein n=1 Tax=Nitrosomonas sp. Nm51 TaxID=133720 RepID=UPI0015A6D5D2|nr:hypothetical protein [Nitrosomonas sp. Nm51]
MSHGTSYGDDEQRRSVPARYNPSVTVIYERLPRLTREKTYAKEFQGKTTWKQD